ncbi:carboxymuconolactone decarboxylase family protein [Leptolinea tardivitalis]|uniref:Carboxymuconolactone decarboxylase-like domain-containing protein n=1 Tax=Leptolinea tardivitalis TaxID=229920 RepID=A0A0P6XMN5_9CHLR|nr:carboxymuconolactone decarboxylase family protein [Leptolinea tardivitalis]KPL70192.1 hypothetical protein ADM99_13430 [Leptolinea tardivitalis]GAP21722.1 alkylhydroperoxidase AhpD family core domain [Leptolinea tardivitalis]
MFLLEETNELYDQFSGKALEAGRIDKKTKELIAVCCSVMADCVPCIQWHYSQAVEAGATAEEISEVLAIPMAISAGSKRAKYGPVVTELQNHL